MMTQNIFKKAFLRFAFLLALLTCHSLLQAAAPQLSSDEPIEVDAKTQSLVAKGNALFVHDDFTIFADVIRFYKAENKAEAIGNVKINREGFRIVGKRLTYNLKTREFECGEFRAGNADLIIVGDHFYGNPDDVTLENARVYFQEPEPASPYVSVAKLNLKDSKKLTVEHLTPSIGNFSLFKLPVTDIDVDDPGIDISARIGFKNSFGAYLHSRTLLPINNGMSIGADLGLYSKRGVLIGPDMEWHSEGENTDFRTNLYTGYIDDDGILGYDRIGNMIDKDRYYVTLTHIQHIGDHIDVTAKLDIWSDSEIIRDYDEAEFERDEEPDNFIEVAYRGDDYIASLFARMDPNEDYETVKRQPELNFDLITSPLFNTSIYHSFHASAGIYSNNNQDLYNYPTLANFDADIFRFDTYYTWQTPVHLSKWAILTPTIGGRYTFYNQGIFKDSNLHRWMGEIGADLELKFYGEWDYKNKTWGINGLRHILKPVVQYRYIKADEVGNDLIRPYDNIVFSTAMPEISLSNMQYIDRLGDANILRLGIQNTLLTRDSDSKNAKDLLHFNIYQDVDLDTTENAWDAFYTETVISPADWFELAYETKTDTESLTMEDQLFRISLKSGTKWKASFYADKLRNDIEEYAFGGYYRINDKWAVRTFLRWDAREDKITEQSYALIQKIGHAWEIGYEVSRDRNDSRNSSTQFSVYVNLLQF